MSLSGGRRTGWSWDSWWVSECMCVCMYVVCVCARARVDMWICGYVDMWMCVWIGVRVCVCVGVRDQTAPTVTLTLPHT